MGLFFNKMEHHAVFKNSTKIKVINQNTSKIDPIAEFMEQQKDANTLLQSHINELESLLAKQLNSQQYQSKEIRQQLNELKAHNAEHEKFEGCTIVQLTKLDGKIDTVNQVSQEIMGKVENFTEENKELSIIMNEQLDVQEKLTDQLAEQKEMQYAAFSRLDSQEALMEKIINQLDYLRSILFERTYFLAKKIEDNFDITSSFIYKLITNSNKSILLLMEKEQQKKIDKKT